LNHGSRGRNISNRSDGLSSGSGSSSGSYQYLFDNTTFVYFSIC
jgi:hypothetical protein